MGTNNMLKKQPIGKVLVSPNFVQSNDILINVITCVSFLRKVCPKSHFILQTLPLFTLWL
jgi:hypothetical protein